MLTFQNFAQTGTLVYSCGTAIVRYIYVRSSFQPQIQTTVKRDSFAYRSVFVGESINYLTLAVNYLQSPQQEKVGRSPLVLYKACLDPNKDHKHLPVHKLQPWNHLLLFSTMVVNVSCNLFLYQFLDSRSDTSIAVDTKKNRKRNLLPAHIGMFVLSMLMSYIAVMIFSYTFQSTKLDSATRAFLNAVFFDVVQCVLCPIIMLYSSVPARQSLKEMMLKLSVYKNKILGS